MKRHTFLVSTWVALAGSIAMLGCSGPVIRPQSPQLDLLVDLDVPIIGDVTRPHGMNYAKVEAVSLITGLDGTGGDPAPTPQRAALLGEMRRRNVHHPSKVLASMDTSLVVVRGFLRLGIQKGDRFDLDVHTASRSDTESLRGGWLLSTRLTELAALGGRLRPGHLLAMGEGPLLVDPSAEGGEDRALLTRGRVLGGGVALKSRSLGLVIDSEHQSVHTSQQIGSALNRRFHTYIRGLKQGIAKPKTDQYIELTVHPRYKDNVARFMRLVLNVVYRETPTQHQQRLELLEQQLADSVTTAMAALRLEAVGKEAIDILKRGMESSDPEVRFYSAEALAYLDETDAAEPLAIAARDEPAFRVHALTALSAMNDVVAYDALCDLLNNHNAETRYGAFRALWAMNSADPLVAGEQLGREFSYHLIDVDGPPMIHVTRSYRPELVLFGQDQTFQLPMILEAGKYIMVIGRSGNRVTISRFAPGQPDQKRTVSNRVDEVVRTIVELGGTYPDVVQALQQAKDRGALAGRFKIDALPKAGRSFDRETSEEGTPDEESPRRFDMANPLPDLFFRQKG